MYKSDTIILSIIILGVIAVEIFFKPDFSHENNLNSIISFLSIYFGFLITSFSIMINSDELKKLYKKTDSENNGMNLLERLAEYYKLSIFSTLLTIICILLIILFNINFLYTFIIPLIIISLYPIRTIFKILFDLFTNKKIF